jgi:hypothetical protein
MPPESLDEGREDRWWKPIEGLAWCQLQTPLDGRVLGFRSHVANRQNESELRQAFAKLQWRIPDMGIGEIIDSRFRNTATNGGFRAVLWGSGSRVGEVVGSPMGRIWALGGDYVLELKIFPGEDLTGLPFERGPVLNYSRDRHYGTDDEQGQEREHPYNGRHKDHEEIRYLSEVEGAHGVLVSIFMLGEER